MTRAILTLPLILAACVPATTCLPRPNCDPAKQTCTCERIGHGDAREPQGRAPDHEPDHDSHHGGHDE